MLRSVYCLVMKHKAPRPEPIKPALAPLLIGYARVSTEEQDVAHQVLALKTFGCHQIYTDTVSGRAKRRPVLDRVLRDLRPQDTLVVTQLDRLARNTIHWHKIMQEVYAAGATFKSLKEDFSFNSSIGKFVLGMLSLVAEFEVNLISDRTKSGLVAARAAGKQIGQKLLFDDSMRIAVIEMWNMKRRDGGWKYTTREVAAKLDISTSLINNRLPGGREAYLRKSKRKR
jgi:DNA invertase Pin-like site-specific DNA recombinase